MSDFLNHRAYRFPGYDGNAAPDKSGVQAKLNKLAERSDFKGILHCPFVTSSLPTKPPASGSAFGIQTHSTSIHTLYNFWDAYYLFILFNHTCIQPYYGGTQFYPVPVCRPGPKVGLDGSTPSADKLSAL